MIGLERDEQAHDARREDRGMRWPDEGAPPVDAFRHCFRHVGLTDWSLQEF